MPTPARRGHCSVCGLTSASDPCTLCGLEKERRTTKSRVRAERERSRVGLVLEAAT